MNIKENGFLKLNQYEYKSKKTAAPFLRPNIAFLWLLGMTSTEYPWWLLFALAPYNPFYNWNAMPVAPNYSIILDYPRLIENTTKTLLHCQFGKLINIKQGSIYHLARVYNFWILIGLRYWHCPYHQGNNRPLQNLEHNLYIDCLVGASYQFYCCYRYDCL